MAEVRTQQHVVETDENTLGHLLGGPQFWFKTIVGNFVGWFLFLWQFWFQNFWYSFISFLVIRGHRVTSVRCTSADFPFGFGGDAVTWRPGNGDAWKEHNLSGYMGNLCTCLDVYCCKKYLESNLLLYRFHQFKDRTQVPKQTSYHPW